MMGTVIKRVTFTHQRLTNIKRKPTAMIRSTSVTKGDIVGINN